MVWYAAYGSNLNRDRFLEYIRGGTSQFNGRLYPGCRNKQEPIRDRGIAINRDLYFAKNSVPWAGGVAFLRPDAGSGNAIGRAYLITADQFLDVAAQENGRKPGDPGLAFDYRYAESHDECYLNPRDPAKPATVARQLWYGRVLRIGIQESWPVVTLTGEWEGYAPPSAPSRQYVATIVAGMNQVSKLPRKAVLDYLANRPGIKDRISRTLLERWL
jgi:hypothetical protein